MRKKTVHNKEGSALLIAIVIMMVVTMLSLALLLVSYSLFATSNSQNVTDQCKAFAQSLSRELEAELTAPQFEKYSDQEIAMRNKEYPFWFYLRFNIWQSSWPYYNIDEPRHSGDYAYRYFTIDPETAGASDVIDEISILIYWESDADTFQNWTKYGINDNKDETLLTIRVTCKKGKQQSTISSTFQLHREYTYSDAPKTENPNDSSGLATSDIYGVGNYIRKSERWTWSLSDRE